MVKKNFSLSLVLLFSLFNFLIGTDTSNVDPNQASQPNQQSAEHPVGASIDSSRGPQSEQPAEGIVPPPVNSNTVSTGSLVSGPIEGETNNNQYKKTINDLYKSDVALESLTGKIGLWDRVSFYANPSGDKNIGFFSKVGNYTKNRFYLYPRKGFEEYNLSTGRRLFYVANDLVYLGQLAFSLYTLSQLKKTFMDDDKIKILIKLGYPVGEIPKLPLSYLTTLPSILKGSFQAVFALWTMKDLFFPPKEDPTMVEVIEGFASKKWKAELLRTIKKHGKKEKNIEIDILLSDFEKTVLYNPEKKDITLEKRPQFEAAILKYRQSRGLSIGRVAYRAIKDEMFAGLELFLKLKKEEIRDLEDYFKRNSVPLKVQAVIKNIYYFDSFLEKLQISMELPQGVEQDSSGNQANRPVPNAGQIEVSRDTDMGHKIRELKELVFTIFDDQDDLRKHTLEESIERFKKVTPYLDRPLIDAIKKKDPFFYKKLRTVSNTATIRSTFANVSGHVLEKTLETATLKEKIESTALAVERAINNYSLINVPLYFLLGKGIKKVVEGRTDKPSSVVKLIGPETVATFGLMGLMKAIKFGYRAVTSPFEKPVDDSVYKLDRLKPKTSKKDNDSDDDDDERSNRGRFNNFNRINNNARMQNPLAGTARRLVSSQAN